MSDIHDICLRLIYRLNEQWMNNIERLGITDMFMLPCEPESRLCYIDKQGGNQMSEELSSRSMLDMDHNVTLCDPAKAFKTINMSLKEAKGSEQCGHK